MPIEVPRPRVDVGGAAGAGLLVMNDFWWRSIEGRASCTAQRRSLHLGTPAVDLIHDTTSPPLCAYTATKQLQIDIRIPFLQEEAYTSISSSNQSSWLHDSHAPHAFRHQR